MIKTTIKLIDGERYPDWQIVNDAYDDEAKAILRVDVDKVERWERIMREYNQMQKEIREEIKNK